MNDKPMTLGSLFDGSGGFPLAGLINGIQPVWSSEIEPVPIAVTKKRLPFVKHYGDVSTMNGGEIEPVDIITFGSPCFPAGTLVLTDKGLVEIENIRVGDVVLTHKGRWRKVKAVGSKEGLTVRLKGNHCGLDCTPNHPIYSFDGKNTSWTRAEDMLGKQWCVPTSVEYLPAPKPKHYEDKQVKPLPEFSEGFFYFIGRWLGDGWVRDSQRSGRPAGQRFATIFLCDSSDKLNELISTVECVSNHYSIEHGYTCVKVKCNGRALCDFLTDNFGKYARGKEIPAWVLSLPTEHRTALLDGILDSDGCRKERSYRITTVGKKLAFGIRLLAESLGYCTSIYFDERPSEYIIQGRKVNQHSTYTVEIFDTDNHYSDDKHHWYKVKNISPASEKTIVYNMTVDEDNSYTADGIVVHNCQDMSIAGKRAGLDGSRSNLFYQAIRIIKEMRKATDGKYPRYAVWENVPGAFSSAGGEDFRCVLESLCRVVDDDVSIPKPQKWENAGSILGENYSVCWRVLDAQYWGVPQRRKRIYLVADFTGGSAEKVLFESEGLSGYSAEGFRSWQRAACCAENGTGEAVEGIDGYNGCLTGDVSSCLGVNCGMSTGRNGVITLIERAGRPGGGKGILVGDNGITHCLNTVKNDDVCVLNDQGGSFMNVSTNITGTLRAEMGGHPPLIMDESADVYAFEPGIAQREGGDSRFTANTAPTLRANAGDNRVAVAYGRNLMEQNGKVLESAGFRPEQSEHTRSIGYEEEMSPTICAGVVPAAVALINRHFKEDCIRVCADGVVPTLQAAMGTGGNNVPLTMIPAAIALENHPTDSRVKICDDGVVPTLTSRMGTGGNNVPLTMIPYGICSKDSNGMKSNNPHSGFYEAKTARTLDSNGGNPCCNQGGIAVVAFTDNFVCEPVCVDQGGGKSNCTVDEGISPPLACTHGGSPAVAFAQNQRNEVRDLGNKAEALAAEPGMHQQTYVIQGSMIGRKDENGPQGDGVNEDVSFTLNTIDRHAVVAPAFAIDCRNHTANYELSGVLQAKSNGGQSLNFINPVCVGNGQMQNIANTLDTMHDAQYKPAIEEEVQPTLAAKGPGAVAEPTYSSSKASFFTETAEELANTLVASDWKDPPLINDYMETDYIVRRLTPTECARLQGFPDWWCGNLGTENPTDEELAEWRDIFETHRRITGTSSKPKTDSQIRKFLEEPYSDSAEYKMWGNGIALPCAAFVLAGIAYYSRV